LCKLLTFWWYASHSHQFILKFVEYFSIGISCKRTENWIFVRYFNCFAGKVIRLAIFVAIKTFLRFKIAQCTSFLWSELTGVQILTTVFGSWKLICFILCLIIQAVCIFFITVELDPRRMGFSVSNWTLFTTFVASFSHNPHSWLSLINFFCGPERRWTEILGSLKVTNFSFDFLYKMLVSLYTWLTGGDKHICKLLVSFLQLRRFFLFLRQLHLQLLDLKRKWLKSFIRCVFGIERIIIRKIDWLFFRCLLIERDLLVGLSVVLAWHRSIEWFYENNKQN
jgi:hypothetical protein